MLLSSLDQTIVSASIYTIANDLDGLSLQARATTAYLITATEATPLYGKLSEIFGRRPLGRRPQQARGATAAGRPTAGRGCSAPGGGRPPGVCFLSVSGP